jgi:GT2 family glycosyltransferase
MKSATPDLSIVVVTHNGRDLALRTLRSAHSHAGGLECEWIVVDSGSEDGTPDAIAEEWPELTLIRRPNIGFAAANNVALAHVRGNYVLLLNPDVEILDGSLADLVARLEGRPSVGAASVIHIAAYGRLLPSAMRFPSPLRQLGEALLPQRVRPGWLEEPVRPGPRYEREMKVDWVSGAFVLLRHEALESVGGLDERFFLYSEETDLCRRLDAAGWETWHLPVMRIAHYGGACDRPELAAQLCRSKLLYAAKHYGVFGRAIARLALALGHALRMAAAAGRAWRPERRRDLSIERAALVAALRSG